MPTTFTAKHPGDIWPADGLENVPSCPVCGSGRRQRVHSELHDGIFRCAPGRWSFYRCGDCRSGWLDPRPTPSTIPLAYTHYYTHGQAGDTTSRPISRWRQFRIAQRNSYLNAHYGYNLKPAAWIPVFLSDARRRRFDAFTGYLRFPGAGARVLDIGCGNGAFLCQMRSLGWAVCGVEPDSQSAAHAQSAGLDVRVGLLQQQSLPEASFDAITAFHVIEHLHNPVETLCCCFKLLKPGGYITLATPNLDSFGYRRYGPCWLGLDPPRHLVLFTEDSLRQTLVGHGFVVSRPPHPCLTARHFFKKSLIVELGGDPAERYIRLPWFQSIKMEWLAAKANRSARKNPAYTEELILLGKKPA
ncbi:MAG TPA: class I SAM-dependent methyltransferase [Candidatus Sulfopaludibacter sp.]|nr:class I SAM-dependent methyltransferase [Candidatus Sulfopaludibacter sp.]